jgi:quinol monooxygenase YgiN
VIIVGGMLEVDPAQRDAFIASRINRMRTSREEPGCLEYVISPDPLNANRVIVFERWISPDSLDAHLAPTQSSSEPIEPCIEISAVSIVVYEVTETQRLV